MRTTILTVIAACIATSAGSADVVRAAQTFGAVLAPVPGIASTATGSATFVLDDQQSEIAFTVRYESLSSPELAAHVHRADGVIVFELPAGPVKSGVWRSPDPLALFQLQNEQLFVLVHSTTYPGGEIRGTLRSGTVIAASTSWGAVKALFDEAR